MVYKRRSTGLRFDASISERTWYSRKRQTPADDPVWEICKIVWVKEGGLHIFRAEAEGPHGAYSAAEIPFTQSASYGDQPNALAKPTAKAHSALLDCLTQDGWVPAPGRGEGWWSYRFMRRVQGERGVTPS